jgi:predicted acyl esterase
MEALAGRVLVTFCAALVALTVAGRASAFTRQDLMLHMDDGVDLGATLYEPTTGAAPHPAIIMLHGLGGTRQELDPIAQRFASTFEVLTFDARGHGQSGGLVSVDGPREIADTKAVFDWLAARPEVDPQRIGAWGISLGGGAVLRSLVEGVPWRAVEVLDTWNDLYGALAPQNLTKSGAIYALVSGVNLDPSVQAIEQDAIASRNLDVLRQWAAQRSSRSLLSQVTTPIYFFQGRRDFVFDIDQAVAGYKLVKGPKQLFIGDFGHSPSTFPGPDGDTVVDEGFKFFQRWVLGEPAPAPAPIRVSPNPWKGKAQTFKSLPRTKSVRVAFAGRDAFDQNSKAQRTSGRLKSRLETFGSARVRFKAKLSGGWSRVVAVLTAKPRRGKTIVVSEGGVNTAGLSGTHTLAIRLISDATVIPKGSKLTLTLASSSLAQDRNNLLYLVVSMPTAARISIGPAQLTLPALRTPVSR